MYTTGKQELERIADHLQSIMELILNITVNGIGADDYEEMRLDIATRFACDRETSTETDAILTLLLGKIDRLYESLD